MGDNYGESYQRGLHGGGYDSNTNHAAYWNGHLDRQRREEEEQRRRQQQSANAWSQWPAPSSNTGTYAGSGGGGAALGILLLIAGGIWVLPFILMIATALGSAAAPAAIVLWLVAPLAGARLGWWRTLGQTLVACLLGTLGAAAFLAGVYFLSRSGESSVLDGLNYYLLTALTPVAEMDPYFKSLPAPSFAALALPALFWLLPATWWMNRSLPATSLPRTLRWAGLAAILGGAPIFGFWAAPVLWAAADPLNLDPLFGPVSPVTFEQVLKAVGAGIALGTVLVAAAAGIASALLRRQGSRMMSPGAAAVRAGFGFVAYALLLIVLLIVYRAGDDLMIGLAEALAPAGKSASTTTWGLPGFALLQLAPFALQLTVAQGALPEGTTLRRLAFIAGAQAVVLAAAVAASAAAWFVLFL